MAATTFATATAADLNVPTAAYPTIQAAVNAANTNGTSHIAPGVYTGQVFITNKTPTLIGQPGTVLRATTNMSPFFKSFPPFVVPIMGVRSSQGTVRGLTFEGERLAEHFPGFGNMRGIVARNSGATVENCGFYGFRESTPGTNGANAIVAANIGVLGGQPIPFGDTCLTSPFSSFSSGGQTRRPAAAASGRWREFRSNDRNHVPPIITAVATNTRSWPPESSLALPIRRYPPLTYRRFEA